jgi:hypothetical protein
MTRIGWFLRCLVLLFGCGFAHAADDRLAIATRIWEPIFAVTQVAKEGRPLRMTPEQFARVNPIFIRAYAEFFDEQELLFQEKMYGTRIGADLARGHCEAWFGGPPFTKGYKDYTEAERAEWDAFVNENIDRVRHVQSKMTGFLPFLRDDFIPRLRMSSPSKAPS